MIQLLQRYIHIESNSCFVESGDEAGDDEVAMKLDMSETGRCYANGVLNSDPKDRVFCGSYLCPPPLLDLSYAYVTKGNQRLNLNTLTGRGVHMDLSSQEMFSAPVFAKEKSASFDSSSLEVAKRTSSKPFPQKQHSLDSPERSLSGSGVFQQDQGRALSNASSHSLSIETEIKELCSASPSMKTDALTLSQLGVSDELDEDADVQVIECSASGPSTSVSSTSTTSAFHQQQRLPKLLKQGAFSISQEWPLKQLGGSTSSTEKALFNREFDSRATSQYPRSTGKPISSYEAEYNMFMTEHYPVYGRGKGCRSLDKYCLMGMVPNSYDEAVTKATDHLLSSNAIPPSDKRKNNPLVGSEFGVPRMFHSWSSIDGVHRRKFQSLDDSMFQSLDDSIDRFHRENLYHMAYRRSFSQQIPPAADLRRLKTPARASQVSILIARPYAVSGVQSAGGPGHSPDIYARVGYPIKMVLKELLRRCRGHPNQGVDPVHPQDNARHCLQLSQLFNREVMEMECLPHLFIFWLAD